MSNTLVQYHWIPQKNNDSNHIWYSRFVLKSQQKWPLPVLAKITSHLGNRLPTTFVPATWSMWTSICAWRPAVSKEIAPYERLVFDLYNVFMMFVWFNGNTRSPWCLLAQLCLCFHMLCNAWIFVEFQDQGSALRNDFSTSETWLT